MLCIFAQVEGRFMAHGSVVFVSSKPRECVCVVHCLLHGVLSPRSVPMRLVRLTWRSHVLIILFPSPIGPGCNCSYTQHILFNVCFQIRCVSNHAAVAHRRQMISGSDAFLGKGQSTGRLQTQIIRKTSMPSSSSKTRTAGIA